MPYFVINEDNMTSMVMPSMSAEKFDVMTDAVDRAKGLARNFPGRMFLICGSLYSVKVPLGEVMVVAELLTKSAIDNAG